MTKEEIKKLNDYFNDIFIELEKKDYFFINSLFQFFVMAEICTEKIDDEELKNEIIQNKLSFEEVYILAREIIEKIDKNYLKDFDNLIKSGELDFDFENEYFDSYCIWLAKKQQRLININRKFNYNDVVTLVHEFIHYTTIGSKNNHSINRYLLSEFLSIYFEVYATNYLITAKNVPKNEIDSKFRFKLIKKHADKLVNTLIPFFVYQKLGDVNAKDLYLLDDYLNITSEEYESNCINILKDLEKIEKDYLKKIKYEKDFNINELRSRLVRYYNINYRYVLGGIIAFYAFANCDIEKIVYLNNHICDDVFSNMDLLDIMNFLNIDINMFLEDDGLDFMEKIINDWNKEVVK